jgi:hypothetical protein
VEDEAGFELLARATLAQYGVEIDDAEMAVILAAEEVYGPHRHALLAADLSDVPPEVGLDPARPPEPEPTGTELPA